MDCKQFESLLKPMTTGSFAIDSEENLATAYDFFEHMMGCAECGELGRFYISANASKEGKFDSIEKGSPLPVVMGMVSLFPSYKHIFREGKLEKVMTALKAALIRSPHDPFLLNILVNLITEDDKKQEYNTEEIQAIEGFAKASEYSFVTQYVAGGVHAKARQVDTAIKYFIKAITVAKDSKIVVFALHDLSICYYVSGRREEAFEAINTALKIAPDLELLTSIKEKFEEHAEPSFDLFRSLSDVSEECQRYMKAA